ncbi:zinc finger MYM-type protein 1 [Artemisia annua]|uniref:Zinc finger MYM-type protein 1 n=1 Tax=Artemisia annua TaxID=35608 RepID=A0A2U1KIA6_ARTAN|nr:zinc finger MYM-type protein 1 [Artemisia annua]
MAEATIKSQKGSMLRFVERKSQVSENQNAGFLNVDDTTGQGLFDVTHDELKSLGLDIDDIRGQGYDNGSNMKGKHGGVQKKFLDINPRAFYTPCGCHSLYLTLCDMANTCDKARNFFGTIQRIYTIFANSSKRWQVLKDKVKGLTLKSLSTTRWESRVESVKAIRLQMLDIREALFQVFEDENDTIVQSRAKSLAENELGDFQFIVAIGIWFDILYIVNFVSKRKKQFDENSDSQDALLSAEESFKVNYFLYIVDQTIASLTTRFEQYQEYENIFGFLFTLDKLKSYDDDSLKSCCSCFEAALKNNDKYDIDTNELYLELRLLKNFLPNSIGPTEVLRYLKEVDCFPNAIITYRVLLTIPVTVVSAERSFSKLKLLRSYLRSTISQERLNGLALIAIENDIFESVNYEMLINNFATENAKEWHSSRTKYVASSFVEYSCICALVTL